MNEETNMHLKKSLKDPVFREEWAKQSAEKIVEMVEQFGDSLDKIRINEEKNVISKKEAKK